MMLHRSDKQSKCVSLPLCLSWLNSMIFCVRAPLCLCVSAKASTVGRPLDLRKEGEPHFKQACTVNNPQKPCRKCPKV